MVGIAVVEGFAETPADSDDLNHIEQGDTQDQQGNKNGPMARMANGIKVREDREHRQEIANQMAAGITEKGACAGEIEREKSKQSAKGQQGDNRDQILTVAGCDHCKAPRADCCKAGAKAI